ncbi:general transcription factor 3C polypeptide 2 isoform X2 [Mycetomoellerius zeteki]|uniref:general transcription factor 3C polypeptide 2 isoform X2 n=1 Tax=Mycetomoellerius zeteki TaxID=64791 RepID=UPI00084E69D6|nr:PREDICTED: general transcription factor 3C polypeptide 2 isoform X2 [Trachymyrmex zeteki]
MNTEDAVTDSNVPHIEKAIQLVTCAKCDQEISKKQWSSHNLYHHNNMAWRKDDEPLDFENDVKLLKRVLTAALKQKKKFLTCEKCEATKRSVNGFISHMQFCGKSEEERQALMVTCPICHASMMPSSMEVHERYHRQLEQSKIKETELRIEKTKRKAAEKAVPRILELTKSLKEQNLSTNDVVQMTNKKKIPSAWKVMWKKELESGITSCKHIGCTFTSSSYETICEHYYQCDFIPQENFMCKICKFSADSRDKITDHITETHSGNSDLEKYSDYETEEDEYLSDESILECVKRKLSNRRLSKTKSDSTRIYRKMAFLDKETTQSPHSTETYKPALRWTLDFELKNYELALFKDDVPNCFTLLENDDATMYLPELTISMAFKHENVNLSKTSSDKNNWKRIKRFESDTYEAVPTFFVGGPIWALAWLPIPSSIWSKNPTQYVAISTHPTMESKYTVRNKYLGPNIIQIWDVGPLNHQVNSKNRSPVLAYAIAHNSGTIWCLEWCPSGCYQDVDLDNYKADESKIRRMGLLAAACSDGCINIYSLPFADELKFEKTENNSLPIYKTDPVMTLVVNTLIYDNNEQDWQCTKLSWTKEHGHSIIAAGFSNGYIGLWHLTTTSPLLLNVRMNTKFINTHQHFFAHYNAITMLALVPYGKSRFLASASVDKSYKFWDLEETSGPQSYIKKGIVSNGAWMMNWPCAILSFDDALGYHYTHSMIVPLREYGYKYCPILATNSPTYGLAVSDHANSIAHGTLAGEVMTIFPHQLLYTEKILPKKRQLNSFIETVDFLREQQHKDNENDKNKDKKSSKEYHYMPETYNECKDRFGIVFHDNLMDLEKYIARNKPNKENTLNNDKLMSIPIEQYPFTSANRMAWNPNTWNYLWLATGYQNGLVRLFNLNFMSNSRDLNALLLAHEKSMLDKKEQINIVDM